ncbi:MAG: hypothetical protein ACLQU1_43830 [Bryobacteraceae bacterium]
MATKKKTQKPGPPKLNVRVPKKWNLSATAIKNLQEALQPIARDTIARLKGPGDVVVCVVRTPPPPQKKK